MRSCRTGLSAVVVALATAGIASAQQPPTVSPSAPLGTGYPPGYPSGVWSVSPNTGTLTGGGYNVQFGYWARGGLSDSPGGQLPIRAYTPLTANGYQMSQPPGTGYVMGYPPNAWPPPGPYLEGDWNAPSSDHAAPFHYRRCR
jgi:hypothetical protein